jgi:hypothetical protein
MNNNGCVSPRVRRKQRNKVRSTPTNVEKRRYTRKETELSKNDEVGHSSRLHSSKNYLHVDSVYYRFSRIWVVITHSHT